MLALVDVHAPKGDPDVSPPLPKEPKSKPGDLWLLGKHRVLCGDSTLAPRVDALLDGVEPHLMVTDPPYGVNYDPDWRNKTYLDSWKGKDGKKIGARAVGKVKNDDKVDWREAWALFPGSVAYVWHSGLHGTEVVESLMDCKFVPRAQIIWVKTRSVISRGNYNWQHEPLLYVVKKDEDPTWTFVDEHLVAE